MKSLCTSFTFLLVAYLLHYHFLWICVIQLGILVLYVLVLLVEATSMAVGELEIICVSKSFKINQSIALIL